MTRPAPIRLDPDTWIVMREAKDRPAAIITRVTDTGGEARFLVMRWALNPAQRRMTGIYMSLEQADLSALWDNAAYIESARRRTDGPPNGGARLPN